MNEAEMRDAKVPTFKKLNEVVSYVESLKNMNHEYGTAVYAMSMAAVAMYNHVAESLGVSGFQDSMSSMDVFRRLRNIEGPFMIVKGRDFLYPQSDPVVKIEEFRSDIHGWLAKEAGAKLDEGGYVHPNVKAHWYKLAIIDPLKHDYSR